MPPNGAIRIFRATGKVKVHSVRECEGIKNFKPNLQGDRYIQSENYEGIPVLSISTPVIWTNGEVVELQMIQLLKMLKQNLTTLILILAGVTLIAMIPITISSIVLGRIVTQPIEKLIKTMSQSRKAGTYEKISMPTDGKDEMAQMGRTFNDMMDNLNRTIINKNNLYPMLRMN